MAKKGNLKDDKEGRKFLGREINLVQAKEPENIVWESKHIKGWKLYQRGILVFILKTTILMTAFFLIIRI